MPCIADWPLGLTPCLFRLLNPVSASRRARSDTPVSQETSVFLKKRAQIEDDYGRAMQKLARERMESYSLSDGKAGSFVTAFQALLRAHDILADNRVKMASQLNEMADQLVETAREVERSRKTAKELGTRLERNLTDSENQTEKSRGRFDLAVEDLERILLSKAGENARDVNNSPHEMANQASMNPGSSQTAGKRTLGKAIGKLKGGPKNPAQVQRMEEEARAKMNSMSDAYRGQVISTQTIRQEYFNLQLPRMLKVGCVCWTSSEELSRPFVRHALMTRAGCLNRVSKNRSMRWIPGHSFTWSDTPSFSSPCFSTTPSRYLRRMQSIQ